MTTTILLVDDSRASRMLCASVIKNMRSDVAIVEAGDGESALERVAHQAPDLAVLDMNMPGTSGLELAEHLRARHPQLRLALLTANVQESVQRRAAALGVTFFRKPIGEAVIASILKLLD
ncbi:response regulator transcription factor [Zoogloea sp.]|uniref:response regulator transcription factor n=1 Tax=Zoogloea sp. TaxID=49181 RepID=UPI0035B4BA68